MGSDLTSFRRPGTVSTLLRRGQFQVSRYKDQVRSLPSISRLSSGPSRSLPVQHSVCACFHYRYQGYKYIQNPSPPPASHLITPTRDPSEAHTIGRPLSTVSFDLKNKTYADAHQIFPRHVPVRVLVHLYDALATHFGANRDEHAARARELFEQGRWDRGRCCADVYGAVRAYTARPGLARKIGRIVLDLPPLA